MTLARVLLCTLAEIFGATVSRKKYLKQGAVHICSWAADRHCLGDTPS